MMPSQHSPRGRDGWLALSLVLGIGTALAVALAAWTAWPLAAAGALAGWLAAHVRALRAERTAREMETGIEEAACEATRDAFTFGFLHAKLLASEEHSPTVH